MSTVLPFPRRAVELTVDGAPVSVPEGSTILDACIEAGIETPTLCYAETLLPANACRVGVVEKAGSAKLVRSGSRQESDGMKVLTDSERVRHSRKMVLKLLGSSVDMSLSDMSRWDAAYGVPPAHV